MNICKIIEENGNSLFIFNGSLMKNEIAARLPESGGNYISMNEALSEGEVASVVFSDDFISKRLESLDTTYTEYNEKILNEIYKIMTNGYNKIVMFFGSDMFCIINMIGICAYIRQLGINAEVSVFIVNESNHEVEDEISFDYDFDLIYRTVLVNRTMMETDNVLIDNALVRYLDYHKDINEITSFIEEHRNNPDLLEILFDEFRDYGLSDLQYKRLINKV